MFKISLFTPFPGKGDDISSALAHHLGDVEGTVGLIGYGDRAIDCLGLHLQTHRVRFMGSLVSFILKAHYNKTFGYSY